MSSALLKMDLTQVLFVLLVISLGLIGISLGGCADIDGVVPYAQAPYHHYTKDVDHCCRY